MGGKIADHEKVLTYRDGNIVEIHTINGNSYKGKKVIFTVGSWLEQIFPDLPMSVQVDYLIKTARVKRKQIRQPR